ncbi:hypothetical protein TRFO_23652 [Tritrichomonas foetus]|uniref:Myb-like DNA-binding domain containing protein n=1 Tax=Tritrichomonas foetus TaxID=1144522 RepID=A0A1J4KAN8_9EUKA|nr:hypothetical protein TRFO_23652 [Tritrichomonas foetus]|eukprot:OHT08026.1 hypothetical protein TRFO_23652 [Tritrichomonas foetus]
MADLFEFDIGDAAEPSRDITQFMTHCTINKNVQQLRNHQMMRSVSPNQGSNPPFKKSKWTPEEDRLLMDSVNKHGMGNWSLVSQAVPGRTGKQCRERWINQLCPALNKDNWTPQEDAILIQQQRIHGNFWTKIAQFLPGRSSNNVKNRWSWLSRHRVPSTLAAQMMPILLQQQQNQSNSMVTSPNLNNVLNNNDNNNLTQTACNGSQSPNPTMNGLTLPIIPKSRPPMPQIHYPQQQTVPQHEVQWGSDQTPPIHFKFAFSDPYDTNLSAPTSYDNNASISSANEFLSFDENPFSDIHFNSPSNNNNSNNKVGSLNAMPGGFGSKVGSLNSLNFMKHIQSNINTNINTNSSSFNNNTISLSFNNNNSKNGLNLNENGSHSFNDNLNDINGLNGNGFNFNFQANNPNGNPSQSDHSNVNPFSDAFGNPFENNPFGNNTGNEKGASGISDSFSAGQLSEFAFPTDDVFHQFDEWDSPF